jgi:SAM-dependent methyltransferase
MRSGAVDIASREAVADYYGSLTSLYRWYGQSAHGWHYGMYGADVKGHSASLTRANEFLLQRVPCEGRDLLDVGCGEGGFTTFAASRGYRATGLTVCLDHLHLARRLAAANGVDHRCRFLIADMDALPFAPASFDVIVNQETWCHSQFKAAYLRQVSQLLRPGGVFRAVDLAVADGTSSAPTPRHYEDVRSGFQVPSLISVCVTDLTEAVKRCARLILAFSAGPRLLTALKLDRWLYGIDAHLVGHYRRHVAACMAFNRGLLRGEFRYLAVSAQKPLA